MTHRQIEEYLNRKIGLDPESIGHTAVQRALAARLAATGLDAQAYWELLQQSELETQELIEALVVPETWFFRDREAFRALVAQACEEKARYHSGRPLRVLSLPCATGEEPYSIAMALLDAQFPAAAFRVDAWDISLRALRIAARASYGKNSFRGNDADFRDRYFDQTEAGYRLNDEVRGTVNFRQANILALEATPPEQRYEAIFCRNMLIYFDRQQQLRAVRSLGELLSPHGMLYTGASESAPVLGNGFVSARIPGLCAFRRATQTTVKPRHASTPGSLKERPVRPAATRWPDIRAPSASGRVQALESRAGSSAARIATPAAPAVSGDWISAAQQLADRGEIAEAMRLCEANLQSSNSSAQAFYVKALLHDAAGESDLAVAHYRKALYLDPGHRDALVQLAAALLRRGDDAGAQHLFERASRAGTSDG